ncbi:MAG: hypothetical protein ACI8RZ_000344 [Myxococcota bacterium]|jgi:hypothetical protein
MSLIHEAIAMITTGFQIKAPLADDLNSTIMLEEEQGAFVLHTAGDFQRFDQATHAVISFRHLVGRAGLSNAVGDVRYQAMFPRGSSLSWSPIPMLGSG